jgi:hypothetical protein
MSTELSWALIASVIGLAVSVGYLDIRRHGRIRPWLIVLVAGAATAVWILARPAGLETKGTIDEGLAIAVCYVAMLLGMVAQYGYAQAERGRRRFRFDLVSFMMPIFASPIVFIPLLSITTDLTLSGAFTQSKLMVYLVAFQNGFFWKSFFEQQRQRAVEQPQGHSSTPRSVARASNRGTPVQTGTGS